MSSVNGVNSQYNQRLTVTVGEKNTDTESTSIWKGLQRAGFSEHDILEIHKELRKNPEFNERKIANGTTIDITDAIKAANNVRTCRV